MNFHLLCNDIVTSFKPSQSTKLYQLKFGADALTTVWSEVHKQVLNSFNTSTKALLATTQLMNKLQYNKIHTQHFDVLFLGVVCVHSIEHLARVVPSFCVRYSTSSEEQATADVPWGWPREVKHLDYLIDVRLWEHRNVLNFHSILLPHHRW